MQKTFNKNYLTRTLGLPDSDYAISDKVIDNDRWTVEHELIFQDPADGKYYKTAYHVGATELQEQAPWEGHDIVHATEVQKRTIIKDEFVDTEALDQTLELEDVLRSVRTLTFANEDGECVVRLSDIEQAIESFIHPQEHETPSTEVSQGIVSPVEEVQPSVTEPQFIINPDDFQKFFEKFKKKMDDVFYLDAETTLLRLPLRPSPEDTFSIPCSDGTVLTYRLADLYETYQNNRASHVEKPLKAIVNAIEDSYDEHGIEEEEELDYE